MLDGCVAAIVDGPASMSPRVWICPARHRRRRSQPRRHGGAPEFAAISAVALRHNEISQVLSTTPNQFARCTVANPNGDIDLRVCPMPRLTSRTRNKD
jgi:uncharacterized protein